MYFISKRKTENRKTYKALLFFTFLVFSSFSFTQSKQLLFNGYTKIGLYPDLNIPFTKEYKAGSGVACDLTMGVRVAYFFSFKVGFAYNYQETQHKNISQHILDLNAYPIGFNGGVRKRKYKYHSIGIPFEVKLFLPVGRITGSGESDLFFGYTGMLMLTGGDHVKDWFGNGEKNVMVSNQRRVKGMHKFMIGGSINAGEQGDADIAFTLGFMAGAGPKQTNYFSLGLSLAYRIYWVEW